MRESTRGWAGLGVILVAVGASFWGVDAVLREPLVDDMSSTAIVLIEHVYLALFAIPVLLLNRSFFSGLGRFDWLAILVIAWGGSGLATVLFTEGFAQGNPTTVILLQKTQPLMVVLLAALLLRERLPTLYWPLFATSLVGVYLVSFGTLDPFSNLGRGEVVAAGLALSAAALWGASTVMGRFLLGKGSFATVTAARFFFALPFLFGLALYKGHLGLAFEGLGNHPGRLFLVALIPGLLGMLVYYEGLSRTPASFATLAELAFPATAVVVNWYFLDATVNALQGVGFVILWVSIACLSWLPVILKRRGAAQTQQAMG